jgi:magnesium transporter
VPEQPTAVRGDSPIVDWAYYRDGVRQTEPSSYLGAVERARSGEGFVWIGLHEPSDDELDHIAADFGLHPLAIEDAIHAHQRPKLEHYEESLFVVLKTVAYVEHDEVTATSEIITTGEVMVFLGENFAVTVRHGDHSGLAAVRRRLEQTGASQLARGPSAVLWAVADTVVDNYLVVAVAVQDDIDEVEASVFSATRTLDTGRIYQLKREVLELRRAIAPLAPPMRRLAEQQLRLVDPSIRQYFRDVEDHLTRAVDQVVGFDELLSSILQANFSQLTVAQNEDLRRISAWVAIIAVPTMIAGIYGMNFVYMPELQWRFGYPLVVVVIVVACALLYRGFRRNGWL